MTEILTLTHATERDIDLLIVEELRCSEDFTSHVISLIAAKTGKSIPAGASQVIHSSRRMYNRREIDIRLSIAQKIGKPIIVLFENKLDAADQPAQAESYREEASILVSSGEASQVIIVLLCPRDYGNGNGSFAGKFDAVINYEEIAEYLRRRGSSTAGELSTRLNYRSDLMQQAIEKWRRGYQAVPLPQIAVFNKSYVALCRENAPLLKPGPSMLSGGRPGESKTMIFGPDTLPEWEWLPQMRIVHQLREGNANVCFYGWGDFFPDLAAEVAADLKGTPYRPIPTVNKRKGGRSGLMIVANTPVVNNIGSWDEQVTAIREGIIITDALRDWVWSHRLQIEKWSEIVKAKSAS